MFLHNPKRGSRTGVDANLTELQAGIGVGTDISAKPPFIKIFAETGSRSKKTHQHSKSSYLLIY